MAKKRVPRQTKRMPGPKDWLAQQRKIKRIVGDTGPIQEMPDGSFTMEIPKDHPLGQGPSPALNVFEALMDASDDEEADSVGNAPIEVIDARRTGREKVRPDSEGIPVQRPVKSLDLHMDTLRWLTTQTAAVRRRAWWDLYFASEGKKRDAVGEGLVTEEEWEEQIDTAANLQVVDEKDMLNRAMTFHVTTGMSELTTAIASHAEERPLRSTDLWSPAGFAVLPDDAKIPYFTPDGPESTIMAMPVKAIAWRWGEVGAYEEDPNSTTTMRMKVVQGVRIWVYSSIEDLRTAWGMGAITRADLGPLPLIDMTSWAVDMEWEVLSHEESEEWHQKRVDSNDNTILLRERGEGVYRDRSRLVVATASYVGFLRKWLLSFWNLLDEEVAVAFPEKPDRAAQKRAQRMGRLPNDGDIVRVVRLRKIIDIDSKEPLDFPEIARRFNHRWRVRSHWRHLQRGLGLLDGTELLVDANWTWESRDGRDLNLRLTDEEGLRERVTIASVEGGIITLAWRPRLKQGYVEVERMAWVNEHSAGAQGGFLVERYDVVSVER